MSYAICGTYCKQPHKWPGVALPVAGQQLLGLASAIVLARGTRCCIALCRGLTRGLLLLGPAAHSHLCSWCGCCHGLRSCLLHPPPDHLSGAACLRGSLHPGTGQALGQVCCEPHSAKPERLAGSRMHPTVIVAGFVPPCDAAAGLGPSPPAKLGCQLQRDDMELLWRVVAQLLPWQM